MAAEHTPRVSIGVPVYNGEALLGQTLDSLLGQSFADFELIISDNASTDATKDICLEFSRRDQRVRYVRQEVNRGAPANWNFVALQARGQFFKWAAASDLCHRDMLARCIEPLLSDPGVALCFGKTRFIDQEGRSVERAPADFQVDDARPSARFRRICHELQVNNAQSGLIRLSMLRNTKLDRLYPHGDRVLMAELALRGKFILLEDFLLFRRADAGHFTGMRTADETNQMFRPRGERPFVFLNSRRHLDFFLSALRAPVSMPERLRAAMEALRGFNWDRSGLREDFAAAASRLSTPDPH